jgi:hypothetical protein
MPINRRIDNIHLTQFYSAEGRTKLGLGAWLKWGKTLSSNPSVKEEEEEKEEKEKIMPFAGKWVEVEIIELSKKGQTQKGECHMFRGREDMKVKEWLLGMWKEMSKARDNRGHGGVSMTKEHHMNV